MPYQKNDDLPEPIKSHLPQEAQTIFRKAFNNALEEYGTEVDAFKVAWSAVKKVYTKNDAGSWVEISSK